jgi:hypothetical protein
MQGGGGELEGRGEGGSTSGTKWRTTVKGKGVTGKRRKMKMREEEVVEEVEKEEEEKEEEEKEDEEEEEEKEEEGKLVHHCQLVDLVQEDSDGGWAVTGKRVTGKCRKMKTREEDKEDEDKEDEDKEGEEEDEEEEEEEEEEDKPACRHQLVDLISQEDLDGGGVLFGSWAVTGKLRKTKGKGKKVGEAGSWQEDPLSGGFGVDAPKGHPSIPTFTLAPPSLPFDPNVYEQHIRGVYGESLPLDLPNTFLDDFLQDINSPTATWPIDLPADPGLFEQNLALQMSHSFKANAEPSSSQYGSVVGANFSEWSDHF